MGKSVTEKSIFGEYKIPEDQVTTALLHVLKYGGHDLVSVVFAECDLPSNEINVSPQVIEDGSRLDGEVCCDCHYHIYIESKIRKGVMANSHELKQLEANRKLASPGDGRFLFYITPDESEPQNLCAAPEVQWLNWNTVIERLKGFATEDKSLAFLIEQFELLVSHLVYSKTVVLRNSDVVLSEEEMASAEDRVIIVGGAWGEYIALKYNFYACQEYRYFKPSRYIAFCHKNRIKYLFEIVGSPKDSVDLRTENISPTYFEKEEPNYTGQRKLFYLKLVNMFSPQIENDSVDKNGKRCAFVQKQTYTTIERINSAKHTSDLCVNSLTNIDTSNMAKESATGGDCPEDLKPLPQRKKYTVELTDKGMLKIHWAKLDDEHIDQLESMMGTCDSSEIGDILFDLPDDNWDLTKKEDSFTEGDHFNLKVTDEAGNVVYETKDPEDIFSYDKECPQQEVPTREEGTYLVSVDELKWFTLTGEFETDNFDPSKFCLCSNLEIAVICGEDMEDMVDFNQFYYDDQRLLMEEQEDYDDYGVTLLKVEYNNCNSEVEEIE